jgi:MFS family permease
MGVLGLVVSLGPAIGPAIGGFLLEVASWRWLFLINLPIGIVAMAAAALVVPSGRANRGRPLDSLGLLLLCSGMPAMLWGAASFAEGGSQYLSLLAIVIGATACIAYTFTSQRTPSPLLDLGLLHTGPFASAVALVVLTGANMYGLLLLLPLYYQNVALMGTIEVGWMLLTLGLGSSVALPFAGWATDRFGAVRVCASGVALLILTTLPLLVLPRISILTLVVSLFARGMGLALAQMPAMTAAYGAADKTQMGDASALLGMAQRIGGVAGVTSIVTLVSSGPGSVTYEAYLAAYVGIMAISFLSILPVGWMCLHAARE